LQAFLPLQAVQGSPHLSLCPIGKGAHPLHAIVDDGLDFPSTVVKLFIIPLARVHLGDAIGHNPVIQGLPDVVGTTFSVWLKRKGSFAMSYLPCDSPVYGHNVHRPATGFDVTFDIGVYDCVVWALGE
jgi:hypothetical protein